MPYVPHQSLKLDINDKQKIWKYFDIYKFLSLLENQSLHFSNVKEFEDNEEGKIPEGTKDLWNQWDSKQAKSAIKYTETQMENYIYACCWCINDYESANLWGNYGDICIQSSLEKIKKVFMTTKETVFFGEVQYNDNKNYYTHAENLIYLATLKNIRFQEERELRLIVMQPEIKKGIEIKVNLQDLIDKIYLSPKLDEWKKQILRSIIKKYSIKDLVFDSEIIYRKK